jgi:Replication-relaxation
MRYPKGSLDLTLAHDYPLLRQIARSRFVTHNQLFEFARALTDDHSRSSFNWRLRRLGEHGLVVRHTLASSRGQYVYSITSSGADYLVGRGENAGMCVEHDGQKDIQVRAQHSIDLNDIQLGLLRAGLLVRWVPEMDIRCENELLRHSYTKDYDAVVTLRLEGTTVMVGLEYERTRKLERHYDAIAAKMKSERYVNQFLYLTANEQLLKLVSWSFRGSSVRVYFGLLADWHRRLLEMEAFSWTAMGYRRLATLLLENSPKTQAVTQDAM